MGFGQKVFKITDGELQFVHPKEGVYIKKNNVFYLVRLEHADNYKMLSEGLKYELSARNTDEIEKRKKDSSTVSASDIIKYDFKKLDVLKFTTKNDITYNDNYRLYKFNPNFFVVSILEDSIQRPRNEYLFHYVVLDFGNNKKIIYHPEGFIVPTKQKVQFLFRKEEINDSFKSYDIAANPELKASDIHLVNGGSLILNHDFYKIDTLQNKKVRIKNIYNQTLIDKKFDSIAFNAFFIAGYKNNKIELYNYTFRNLKLDSIKSFSFQSFYPSIQVIDHNNLRNINLAGTNYTSSDLNYYMSFNHFFPNQECRFNITKKDDYFYFETDCINSIIRNYSGYESRFKIKNSNEFETIQFLDQPSSFILYSEMMGYTHKDPFIIYTKLKNGKFNLNSLEYLLTEKPAKEIEDFNTVLPKNLDSVYDEWQQIYRIEKNGLFTFYPIIKDIKYKKLEEFQGNYARFELPNGQKGWLSLQGKEYLDN